jgi:hypothetical protein
LSCLQVLSLGSNKIKREGALHLARAFSKYPSLHRVVLHNNKDLDDEIKDESGRQIFHQALVPTGWERTTRNTTSPTPSTTAMAVLSPLILPNVLSRWKHDKVLIRPYEELRRQLKHCMYKKDSTFVDSESQLKIMPDILAWMSREHMCHKQTSLNSHFDYNMNLGSTIEKVKCVHSGTCSICPACACAGLNDVYELLQRMPHLLCLLRNNV